MQPACLLRARPKRSRAQSSPLFAAWLCVAAFGLAGCASNLSPVLLKPVGPASTESRRPIGFLIVATAVEEPDINPNTNFYPHIGYAIYDSHGAFVRNVRNHLGAWDEQPERVDLPPGQYTVKTKGEREENLVIPVIIETARTTYVDLNRGGHSLVRLCVTTSPARRWVLPPFCTLSPARPAVDAG